MAECLLKACYAPIQARFNDARVSHNAALDAISIIQCSKHEHKPSFYRAPMTSRGPICLGMLKPNKLTNHNIAYTKVGDRRSSV